MEDERVKLWEMPSPCILSFKGFLRCQACWQGRRGILITAYLLSPGTVTASSGDTCRCSSPKVNSRGQPVLNNDAILLAPESSKDAVARD